MLHAAASHNKLSVVQHLLDNKADIEPLEEVSIVYHVHVRYSSGPR